MTPTSAFFVPGLRRALGSRARGALTLGLLASALQFHALARADASTFVLPTAGCPIAHCDARMSDGVNMVGPSKGQLVRGQMRGHGGFPCAAFLLRYSDDFMCHMNALRDSVWFKEEKGVCDSVIYK